MLVYGKNVAKDLLSENHSIKEVFLQDSFSDKEIINLLKNKNIPINIKTKKQIDNLCSGLNQGIILSIPDYQYNDLNSIINSNSDDVIVILDHIEDPHNLGAIIRTCEAAGIKSIVLSKNRQVQVNATVMKTSVGTLQNMNLVSVSSIANCIDVLKDNDYWIVGTSLSNSIDYRDVDYSGKIAIVIGNEGSGISALVAKKCDFLVKIPMFGKTNSLNASVAAGIIIYEVIRNRKKV